MAATQPSASTSLAVPSNEQERGSQNNSRAGSFESRPRRNEGPSSRANSSSSFGNNHTGLDVPTTWSEFLRDTRHSETGESSSQRQIEARRNSIMALDRKRRLTGSLDESVRRRAASGGIYRHGPPYDFSPEAQHFNHTPQSSLQSLHWGASHSPDSSRGFNTSPTTSSQQYPRRMGSVNRSGVRGFVRPPWQPDSEVSSCPICGTKFTFWYRKHHCRKCGRVVCAACSPHRITIPRQFIVQPPGSPTDSFRDGLSSCGIDTVDLTSDEMDDHDGNISGSSRRPEDEDHPSAGLGGGEEVRLCNPCVPDPNPNPPQPYAHFLEPPTSIQQHFSNNSRGESPPLPVRFSPYDDNAGRRSAVPIPDYAQYGRRYGPYHASQGLRGDSPTTMSQSTPSSHRSGSGLSSGSRARVLHQRGVSAGYHGDPLDPFPGIAPQAAPAPIPEEDQCPVCHDELPPKGPDGNETARETHIASCIERYSSPRPRGTPRHRQASHGSSPPRQETRSSRRATFTGVPIPAQPGRINAPLPPTPVGPDVDPTNPDDSSRHRRQSSRPIAYATHIATEKDCVAEDGGERECSICLEEFEVGDELAVLECLCKFHKACIRNWLEKAGKGCPLHKILDLEAGL